MPSPEKLLAAQHLAATLRDQADAIRARARPLGTAEAAMRWQSWGAIAFQDKFAEVIAQLTQTAARFDTAADEVLHLAAAG